MTSSILNDAFFESIHADEIALEELKTELQELSEFHTPDVEVSVEDLKDLVNRSKRVGTRLLAGLHNSNMLMRKRVALLQKRLDWVKGKEPSEDKIKIGKSINILSKEKQSKGFNDIHGVVEGVRELNTFTEETYLPSAMSVSEAYLSVIENTDWKVHFALVDFFDMSKTNGRIKELVEAFEALDISMFKELCKEEGYVDSAKKKSLVSESLAGNNVLYLKAPLDSLEPRLDPVNELRRHRKVIFGIGTKRNSDLTEVKNGEIETLTWKECATLLADIDKHISNYEQIIERGVYSDLLGKSDDIFKAAVKRGLIGVNVSSKVRSFAWLYMAPLMWSAYPYLEIATLNKKINKAILTVIEKSIATYEKSKD